ncbi:DUF1906 domain-containing protein [Burkholderia ubonensis]|uniref:DUF1906 domain-containing protein n=1 Tax=Burkholderia ubonensis TaxID=101571 RepID=UPI0009B3A509|nr:DUF1906 domain-containing protein [Burkholderia ubonensis]
MLSGTVQSAPTGSRGFDTDTSISSDTAQKFANQGYTFCIRYLSLGAGQAPGDLSITEANDILEAGLALMAVQHAERSGWGPSKEAGDANGGNAAENADAVGFPRGVIIWCDLEDVASKATAQDVIDYCTAWFVAVSQAGYVPGLYVGANAGLTGQQLYDLPFEHYWQSCSEVPAIPVRGYQMVQTRVSEPVNGIGVDDDVTAADFEGGRCFGLPKTEAGSTQLGHTIVDGCAMRR